MVVILVLFVSLAAVLMGTGCAGPSRERTAALLHQCRAANRERARLVKEYEARPLVDTSKCSKLTYQGKWTGGWICPEAAVGAHPEQAHGALDFSEAGF